MATMNVQKLRKSFGNVEILRGIDLDVGDGEFVALVGPSGCGKSTLLRLIAGLEVATSGQLIIGGKDVTSLPPKDRDVAMVFQNYALYPHMTVGANMGFSLKLRGASKDEIQRKVDDAAAILGLADLLERYPGQLSGGQRQRVATGRALVRDPALFLFDEPLSNLDAKLRVQMRTEIKSLHQRLGNTMIYVTHDQIEAMTLADRIVVMQAGRIEQQGRPLDLYDRPANAFVGGFLGSPAMNFIKGRLVEDTVIASDGTVLPAPLNGKGDSEGREVLWGARPESIVPSPDGFEGKIEVVEPTGPDTQLLVTVAGEPLVVLLRSRMSATAGDVMTLGIAPEDIHLFDAESGARIEP